MRRVSLPHPMLTLFLCREILLHIPCCLHFYAGSFSYTSRAVLIFMEGVSLARPMLASFLFIFSFFLSFSFFLNLGSFSYTSRTGFLFYFFFFSFFDHGSFSYTSRAAFIFIWGVFTHPVSALFLSREFLLHIPCWFYFSVGNFSYTSHAVFIFVTSVCLTHPVLFSFL